MRLHQLLNVALATHLKRKHNNLFLFFKNFNVTIIKNKKNIKFWIPFYIECRLFYYYQIYIVTLIKVVDTTENKHVYFFARIFTINNSVVKVIFCGFLNNLILLGISVNLNSIFCSSVTIFSYNSTHRIFLFATDVKCSCIQDGEITTLSC